MRLILGFSTYPSPLRGVADAANNGLATGMDIDVLNCHPLLTLAAVAIEGFEQCRIGSGAFVGLGEIFAPAFEGLFAIHGASLAFHRGVVGGDQLRRHHAY